MKCYIIVKTAIIFFDCVAPTRPNNSMSFMTRDSSSLPDCLLVRIRDSILIFGLYRSFGV